MALHRFRIQQANLSAFKLYPVSEMSLVSELEWAAAGRLVSRSRPHVEDSFIWTRAEEISFLQA